MTKKNEKKDAATKGAASLETASTVQDTGAKPAALGVPQAETAEQKEDAKARIARLREELKAEALKAAAERKAKAEAQKKVREEAKAERETKAAAAKAAREAAKEERKNRTPVLVTQLDEHGNEEQVDRNVFTEEIVCSVPGCGQHRFVTKSGLLEVTMCKPHARKERRNRRIERVKDRNRSYKAIVEEALRLDLFPESFRKEHGL